MALKSWLKFSSIWFLAGVVIIMAGAVVPTLNQQVDALKEEIIKSLSVNGLTPNPLTGLKGDSAYNILNFLLSYGSFQAIFSLNGFGLFKFWVIDLYIFLPVLGVFAVGTAIFVVVLLTNATAAHWKWNARLLVGKILTTAGGITLYLALFLGLFLVAIVDNSSFVSGEEKHWYNLPNGGLVTWTNQVQYQSNVFSVLGLIINQSGLNNFFVQAPGVLQVGAAFIIFIAPIAVAMLTVGLAIRIAIELLLPSSSGHRGGIGASFGHWLGYINISSRRELRKRLGSNIGMILLMIGFLIVMIFPAFTSTTRYVKANWIILAIAIVLMVISFIPLYFMLFCLARLQEFSYNLLMFVQMLTWLVIGLIWQILMWTEFKQYFQYPAVVPVIMIFFFVNILLVSFYLLVRGYRK
ncbi:motility-associated protein Scm1 [Spiroplasma sp. SV19]|uniref:motility-associated protein Scm1 n=1 Tax=Spiroplasma sp. SV19 TaxID=2570468 RepID=UPI0024B84AA5|nr:motility-associated protein Scm1 [Spiroplasma sp. SV19]WHQ36486.1 motility-associated protein Scm1 [Spiroplasma sp. SV19]